MEKLVMKLNINVRTTEYMLNRRQPGSDERRVLEVHSRTDPVFILKTCLEPDLDDKTRAGVTCVISRQKL